jgi:dihydrodipicolinate synthase/N-acetylneuraminate lyase
LVHQALFGDFSSARESHRLLYPLLTALDAVPTASGVKEVLTLIGQSNAGVRPPLSALNGPDRQRIYDALAALPPDWNPQLR